MNKRYITLGLAALLAAGSAQAGLFDALASLLPKQRVYKKPVAVKVLLMHDVPGATIGVTGRYKIYDPNTNELISSRFVGKEKYMQSFEDGLKWHEEFPAVHQLLIVPEDPRIGVSVNGVPYQGSIYVYDVGGTISVVNELSVEAYLTGLLARQIHNPYSEETMAALAIVARTDTFYLVEHPRNRFWTVDSREVGYKGHEVANPSSPVTKAIEETRGMVLTLGEDECSYFPARWSGFIGAGDNRDGGMAARITLLDADELAKRGGDAREILQKAYPGSKLQLTAR